MSTEMNGVEGVQKGVEGVQKGVEGYALPS